MPDRTIPPALVDELQRLHRDQGYLLARLWRLAAVDADGAPAPPNPAVPDAPVFGAELDQAQVVRVRNVLHDAGECRDYETADDVRRVLAERDRLRTALSALVNDFDWTRALVRQDRQSAEQTGVIVNLWHLMEARAALEERE